MPKPYTAVTVSIEGLTSESHEEDDLSGIPELVEIITIQASGPTEAARAIRKKLKYGNVHRQLRALVILDGLIQNAGSRFQRCFCDEALLERLRVCGTGNTSHPEVKKKCNELFRSWAQFKNVEGMRGVASLYKQLPRRKAAVTQERSKVIRETENPFDDEEDDEDGPPRRGESSRSSQQPPYEQQNVRTVQSYSKSDHKRSSSSGSFFGSSKDKDKDRKKKDKKGRKRRPFNLEAEKESMKATIAESSIAATNLMNALKSINRERERISDNRAAVEGFEACKQLRRKVLRYIHHVTHEQWLGSLLKANDDLILALLTYEQLDHSVDADSDSEDELAEQAHLYRMAQLRGRESNPTSPVSPMSPTDVPDIAGLGISESPPRPAPPPRPSANTKPPPSMHADRPRYYSDDESEDDDDDNPFADRNAMAPTPVVEQGEFRAV